VSRAPYKRREPGSLKEATARLITACGGQRKAAELVRVKATQIASYSDSDAKFDRVFMPVDIAAVLEAHCGAPIVTRYLALARGALVIDLPKAGDGPYSEKLARMASEGGQTFAAGARAISDGKITLREARTAKAEAIELASAVAGYISDLDGVITKGNRT
jgi:hypothetical protein